MRRTSPRYIPIPPYISASLLYFLAVSAFWPFSSPNRYHPNPPLTCPAVREIDARPCKDVRLACKGTQSNRIPRSSLNPRSTVMARHVSPASLAALVFGALIVGTAPIFVRYSDVGAGATAFWRLALAGLVLLPFLLHQKHHKQGALIRGNWTTLIVAGFCFALDMWVWNAAIMMIPVAKATLFVGIAPIHVALYTVLVLKQKLRPLVAFCIILAIAGAAFLASPAFLSEPDPHLSGSPIIGHMLAILGGVAYAGYVIAVARSRAHLGTLEVMCLTSLIGAAFTIPPMLIEGSIWPTTTLGWSSVLVLALVVHVLGQGLIAYALAKLPVMVCSLGLMLQPVSAAVAGWLLFDEFMGGLEWMGALFVVTALVLVNWPQNRPTPDA